MRPNPIKRLLKEGKPAVGTWLIYLAALLTLTSMSYYLKLALAPRAEGDRRRLDRRGIDP